LITIAQQLLVKGKKTLFLLISSFILALLFTAGTIISVLEASAQYDARGSIFFTALLASSLAMVGISVLLLAVIFWPRPQAPLVVPTQTTLTHPAHPIEEILRMIIAEGVEYLKDKPERAKARSSEYSQA
jgi:predicted anti-sigma-YlaC factor YlaD